MEDFRTGICMYKQCVTRDNLCKDSYCEQHSRMHHTANHTYPNKPPSEEAQQYNPQPALLVAVTEDVA